MDTNEFTNEHERNRDESRVLYKDLSFKVIGLAMDVHRKLGHGFLEKVYENAMMVLFRKAGIRAIQQAPIKVYFEGEVVGSYIADILVEEKVILELKALDKLTGAHRAQTLNYLKATGLRLAIIINFGGKRLEYERVVN
ncbi:MAG TPA: GxxExxY protein [Blastocatellia bacterium]|nr:GxxExxY protein [Blastocatellia bacterium]